MPMQNLKNVIEAILFSYHQPLTVDQLFEMLEETLGPGKEQIKMAICQLQADYAGRGLDLVELASGFRFRVRQQFAEWVAILYEEKPHRYSRALLETLALIAYRQPVTRGDIEDVRGVAVSSNIIKTLVEREWIRVVGHRDVPGRPAMYATTRQFLDYFNLQSLDQLPPLAQIRDLEEIGREIESQVVEQAEIKSEDKLGGTDQPIHCFTGKP
ncbi:MAG: SMC-Scp complex subunit ScpB [Gammaproteobacteria bacterium]|nr:MAG: SMC-Scp complex subunit ScpB [Gammaproteobacteria bacterium]